MLQSYNIISPPDILKNHVRYFWTLDISMAGATAASFQAYVDDSQGMSFQIDCNQSVLFHNGVHIPIGMLHGLNTMPSTVQYSSSFSSFGLVFYPYVVKEIFGMDACHFTNAQVSIEDYIERFLTDQIVNAKNTEDRIAIITAYLLNKLNKKTKTGTLAKQCVHFIQSNGSVNVKDVVDKFNTTERTLERIFKEQVGVTPRHFIKTAKFQKALRLISTKKYKSLTEIAYDLRYTDQSHFIRHVRQLSGMSPKNLQKQYKESAINIIL